MTSPFSRATPGPAGTDADIAGFQTTLAAAREVTITQANKILAAGTLAAFAGMVDGRYANAMGDLRAVLSVGANTLWASTVPNAASGNQRTIAAILRENGLTWTTRDGNRGRYRIMTTSADTSARLRASRAPPSLLSGIRAALCATNSPPKPRVRVELVA